MRMRSYIFMAILAGWSVWNSHAYEFPNHYDMSSTAATISTLATDAEVLHRLGLKTLTQRFNASIGEDSPNFTNECKHGKKFELPELLACGAQFEDVPPTRALNHFYDPANDIPLTVMGVRPGEVLGLPNLKSPDWALQDQSSESGQDFSYSSAREYLFRALTQTGPQSVRDEYWGKMFQAIGQVIHHVQDSAQPQHVRNDQHLQWWIPGFYNPSLYELYTRERRGVLQQLMSETSPVWTDGAAGPFDTPRAFWKNVEGTGIAEFTNRNFVSTGTLFAIRDGEPVPKAGYSLPVPGDSEDVGVEELPGIPQDILNSCREVGGCQMTFVSTHHDVYNRRAATLSIFDQYLRTHPALHTDGLTGQTYLADRGFALNRFNFDSAHALLIPRAVSYSAGLINYFFRGKMEISLPSDGVYAVLDHNTPEGSAKEGGGFDKIKLRLRNLTPSASGIEAMQGGSLRAIVKFHRNRCYAPDLSGEYGAPGIDWRDCRSTEEEIVVSDPIVAPPGINEQAQEIGFSFPERIPVSGTDLFLQVVYDGALGRENRAVVVATKDISEPTYAMTFDVHDQFLYSHYPQVSIGSYTLAQWCQQAVDAGADTTVPYCSDWYWVVKPAYQFSATSAPVPGFDPSDPAQGQLQLGDPPASFDPVASLAPPTGSFARIAVLTDAVPTNAAVVVEIWDSLPTLRFYEWHAGTTAAATVQIAPDNATLTPTQRWAAARGVFLPPADAAYVGTSAMTQVGPLKPVTSRIDF